MSRKAVVLFSGGIDSLSSLIWAMKQYRKENVTALYVDLGHRYAQKELKAAREITKRLGVNFEVVEAHFVGKKEKEDAPIPWRNLFLILTACYFLPDEGGDIIIQNVQVGETSIGDRTPEFNRATQELLSWIEGKRVKVIAPFADYTKGQIVRWLLDVGKVDLELIKLTVGCFSEEDGRCGKCPACFRLWIACETAGIECRHWFNNDPVKWEGTKKYAEKMLRGEYDDRRVVETLTVLLKYGIIKGIVVVDLDEVLCKATPWWDYANAEPIRENIEKVNKLYDMGYGIWIHTSRFECDREVTEWWLREHGVKYHRLIMGKPWATHYIDDKNCLSLDEVLHHALEKEKVEKEAQNR